MLPVVCAAVLTDAASTSARPQMVKRGSTIDTLLEIPRAPLGRERDEERKTQRRGEKDNAARLLRRASSSQASIHTWTGALQIRAIRRIRGILQDFSLSCPALCKARA